jgi:multiple sugar transport system permease protein
VVATGPIVYLVATSLEAQNFSRIVNLSVFAHPNFANYVDMWTQYPVGRWLVNSLIVATSVTLVAIFLDSAAGYAFAKLRFRGREIVFISLLAAVMVPLPVTLLTTYLLLDDAGQLNTYQALIVPALAYPVGVFLMRQFISTLPSELLDAARIDGMSELRIYLRVVLPLSIPGVAVLALFTFMLQWGSLLWPLVATTSDSVRTIQPGLATMPSEYSTDWGLLSATALISMIPMLCVFLGLQRYVRRGIVAGMGPRA